MERVVSSSVGVDVVGVVYNSGVFVGHITCIVEFVVSSGVNVVGVNVVGGVYSRNFTRRSIGCFVHSTYSTSSMGFVVSSGVGLNVVGGVGDKCWSRFNGWRPSGTECFPE
mmetsp:Transcript_31946/g.35594  ORF Transcript_31946/g.35594 Transcript_31946/m.35594 type:complete len:111 (+) Transcript_31946:147-479(+)